MEFSFRISMHGLEITENLVNLWREFTSQPREVQVQVQAKVILASFSKHIISYHIPIHFALQFQGNWLDQIPERTKKVTGFTSGLVYKDPMGAANADLKEVSLLIARASQGKQLRGFGWIATVSQGHCIGLITETNNICVGKFSQLFLIHYCNFISKIQVKNLNAFV
ncbi:hypothetical protein V6N13_138547 [Hibiscus sabdariffa]|uniref:Uncharacterized protein n=1 Tax=Hibiscus sabdariffa TaxID=183260 RepID=A0ABR2PJ77_9ROSI